MDNFSHIGLWFPITDPVNPNYWCIVVQLMGCDKQKKEIKEIKKSICVKTDYFDLILFCLHLKRVTDTIVNHRVISLL